MAKARVALVEEQMMVPVAIDDGHSMGKLAMIGPDGQIVERSYRSRTTVGISEMDTDGIVAAAAYFHDIDDPEQASPGITPVLTVQDTTGHEQAVDNRTGDYPKSARNRVLVHHGLHAIGHVRGPVMLGTTLPYGDTMGRLDRRTCLSSRLRKPIWRSPSFPWTRRP